MKIFSAGARPPKSKRSTAINCLLVNQFATPGLGSLMGGRILAGLIELGLALAGFALFVLWMLGKFGAMIQQINETSDAPSLHPWMGKLGLALFAGSWILSWFTSLSLLRHAPPAESEPSPSDVPPIIPPPKI